MPEGIHKQKITLPLLPMREDIIFPGMTVPFFIGRKQSMEAVEKALGGDRQIFVITQKDTAIERPNEEDLYQVGTLGNILQIMRLPNGTLKALFEAKSRGRLIEANLSKDFYSAVVEPLPTLQDDGPEIVEIANKVKSIAKDYIRETKKNPDEIDVDALLSNRPDELGDKLAPMLSTSREIKQELLEEIDPKSRLDQVFKIMNNETHVRQLEKKLKEQVRQSIGTQHRDEFLQDQLKAIQKELGQGEDSRDDFEELERQIKESKMPKNVEDVARKELKKLRMMSPMSAEANVGRNYLDWLISLPWVLNTVDSFDLLRARQILDEDHYGLEKVKERIIEYIAVSKMKGHLKGPILCFVGPPGVGKTSLAKSIARALNRNFARMSLGGIRDEAEIRGHRRTYIGALPGKIIQAIRKAKSHNPVILMDEIDKLYASIMGDPSAAMLEVLDPEQNKSFMDHYIEVEYDLSQTLFICTANTTQSISPPLLDRMEVIYLPGYTELEKLKIAQNYLVPKQLLEHGLEGKDVKLSKDAILKVIENYTREAGVRGLEREIGKVFRKVVTQVMKLAKDQNSITINGKTLTKYLGVARFHHQQAEEQDEVGLTNGLGVTSAGGELLITEVETMSGNGRRSMTGQLGDVMKESAEIAYSYVRSKADELGILTSHLKKIDIHIHLPENAQPKDGPSAGVTLVTSLVSALTKIPVRRDIAMTGEVTLRGLVLKIGGLKEKLLAARRSGMKEVLIPKDNEPDLIDVPDEITKEMKITPVNHLDEVISIALVRTPKPLTPEVIEQELKRLAEFNREEGPGHNEGTDVDRVSAL
ncbi:MAG: endopeptidase La [Deltaproteobacteria bacterium]|nr:endopeptidase La [Deltaproteobacteria bacterium]